MSERFSDTVIIPCTENGAMLPPETISNAVFELLRERVDYFSSRPGGRGAVREVCEFILEAQGKLAPLMARWTGTPE